jgi:8-oxo-dGTP diphosphatase
VLLGRRCIEPFNGWWDVPGGFLEPWEHPEEGVVREAAEETGLAVRPIELLGVYMDVYGYSDGTDQTLNLYYVVEIVEGEPRPGDDLVELRFFGPDEIPEDVAFETGRQALRDWRERR